MTGPLHGRRVALLETREADRLAAMLREEGAEIVACPAVAIVLPADPAPALAWLGRFMAAPFDDLILLTGEGLYRLRDLARPAGIEAAFLAALNRTRTICRGPKPVRALRVLGQQPQLRAEEPTTDGVVALLSGLDLRGRRVGVQLYPGAGDRLVAFLDGAGAVPDPVTPYEYASQVADESILMLIDQLAAGAIDVVRSPARRRFGAFSTWRRATAAPTGCSPDWAGRRSPQLALSSPRRCGGAVSRRRSCRAGPIS